MGERGFIARVTPVAGATAGSWLQSSGPLGLFFLLVIVLILIFSPIGTWLLIALCWLGIALSFALASVIGWKAIKFGATFPRAVAMLGFCAIMFGLYEYVQVKETPNPPQVEFRPTILAPMHPAPVPEHAVSIPKKPVVIPSPPEPTKPPAPVPSSPVTLLASDGASLMLRAGTPYFIKLRTGKTTTLTAKDGMFALYKDGKRDGECRSFWEWTEEAVKQVPYEPAAWTFEACGSDVSVVATAK